MLKKDLHKLFNDAKLTYYTFLKLVKSNILYSSITLVIYVMLFFVDPFIREWFSKLHNHFFDVVFTIGHYYGKFYLTFLTVLILYLVGIIYKNENVRRSGWMFFESFLISGLIVTVLKSLFGRWRPYTGNGNLSFVFLTLGPNDHLSLPSGDVAIAFAYSTIAASFINNKLWKVFWFGLAVLTAFGRIYHDQHWFTDAILAAFISVLVGYCINKQNIEEKE